MSKDTNKNSKDAEASKKRTAEQRFKAANEQLRAYAEELRKDNIDIASRIKEFEGVCGLSQLIEEHSSRLEEILCGLVELMPPAWQYPEITGAAVLFADKKVKTANFKKTRWMQSADIEVSGEKLGMIKICYLKEMPTLDEGPFLKEERRLIDIVAERIGRVAERIRAVEQLQAANQQLRAANQQLQATEQQLRAANHQLKADEQQLRAANQQLGAANQQLQATEQQLRAANHQLKADEQQLQAANQQLRAANQQLQATEQQLRAANQQLRALANELSSVEESQGRRIAGEIHDNLIQPLVFLDIKVKSLLGKTQDNDLLDSFDQMRAMLAELIRQSRLFTLDLSDPVLYELGLEAAIEEWMRTEIWGKHKIAVEFRGDGRSRDMDHAMATFLFKAVKELLINIVKHAEARTACVSITTGEQTIEICVQDDGLGFDYDTLLKKGSKTSMFGLFNIRTRLAHLGGSMSIEAEDGCGCKVILKVPMERNEQN